MSPPIQSAESLVRKNAIVGQAQVVQLQSKIIDLPLVVLISQWYKALSRVQPLCRFVKIP